MAASEGFSAAQRAAIDKAIREAETQSRLEYSVYVGSVSSPIRVEAERMHASLASPQRSVLLVVDPAARAFDVVTGSGARRQLDDEGVSLAVVTMQSDFAKGDLVGGIVRGLRLLAERAHEPTILHADQP